MKELPIESKTKITELYKTKGKWKSYKLTLVATYSMAMDFHSHYVTIYYSNKKKDQKKKKKKKRILKGNYKHKMKQKHRVLWNPHTPFDHIW